MELLKQEQNFRQILRWAGFSVSNQFVQSRSSYFSLSTEANFSVWIVSLCTFAFICSRKPAKMFARHTQGREMLSLAYFNLSSLWHCPLISRNLFHSVLIQNIWKFHAGLWIIRDEGFQRLVIAVLSSHSSTLPDKLS